MWSTTLQQQQEAHKVTGRVGLVNQGCTCYLSSLIQLLYHLSYFRSAVYKISSEDGTDQSVTQDEFPIAAALQELFFQMQERTTAPTTKGLTDAFGWGPQEVFIQHDIQEMNALLRDNLEGRMKGTAAEGAINRLFEGKGEQVVATLDGTYTSVVKDIFYELHLPLQHCKTINESLQSLVVKDKLTGDNKYKVEKEGAPAEYKDAEKGYRFVRFPPVLLLHLKRFEMDLTSPTLEMKKVNSEIEFGPVLDLSEFEAPPDNLARADSTDVDQFSTDSKPIYDLCCVIVHRGTVRSGHYFCYIREFDHTAKDFCHWLEFDDDDVRIVDEKFAIDNNFGGWTISATYGTRIPKSQSAYVLAYIRRADRDKVMYPTPTNIIPQRVADQLRKVMAEEEQRCREELERNSKVTVVFVTDSDIARHVQRFATELIEGTTKEQDELKVGVFCKSDEYREIYNYIYKTFGIHKKACRVWWWKLQIPERFAGYRPSKVLPEWSCEGTLYEVLTASQLFGETELPKAWKLHLYIEKAQVGIDPPLITNIGETDVDAYIEDPSGAVVKDNRCLQGTTIATPKSFEFLSPFALDSVAFRVYCPKEAQSRGAVNVFVECFLDDVTVTTVLKKLRLESTYTCCEVNVGGKMVNRVVISRKTNMWYAFSVSRVQFHVSPSLIHQPQPNVEPALTPIKTNSRLLMIKFFDYRTPAISFLGSLVVDIRVPLRNYFPSLYSMLRCRSRTGEFPKLKLWDESFPYPLSLINTNQTAVDQTLLVGNIVTLQLDDEYIPKIYRFTKAEDYYAYLQGRREVVIRNVKSPADTAAVIALQGYFKHNEILEELADHLKKDQEFLRLYRNTDLRTPVPSAEPEQTDSELTLDEMLKVSMYPGNTLFYEELSVSRHVLESIKQLEVTFSDERGEPQGEPVSLVLEEGATIFCLVSRALQLLGRPFDQDFVFLHIADHLIRHIEEVTPTDTKETSPPLTKLSKEMKYEIRPVNPLPSDHIRVLSGHMDNTRYHSDRAMYGSPFIIDIPKSMTIEQFEKVLIDFLEVPEEDVADDPPSRVMLHNGRGLVLNNRSLAASQYLQLNEPDKGFLRCLLLNHKRPKEKPGSRYVAANDPQLVIGKRKPNNASPGK